MEYKQEETEQYKLKEHAIVYEWADTNYSAYVPDLPGCVTTGKTLDKTKHPMRRTLAMHIEAMLRDGDPIPEPTTRVESMALAA